MNLQGQLTLNDSQQRTASTLTSARFYGGAIAWHAEPCVVIYGTPVWIMPNGKARVGSPNAPMMEVFDAIREIRGRLKARQDDAMFETARTIARAHEAERQGAHDVA